MISTSAPVPENGTNGHVEEMNGHANGHTEEINGNGHAEENGKEEVAEEKAAPVEEKESIVAAEEPPVKKAKKTPKKTIANPNRRSSSRLTGPKLSSEISSDNLPKGVWKWSVTISVRLF